jgi:hypothetical protein
MLRLALRAGVAELPASYGRFVTAVSVFSGAVLLCAWDGGMALSRRTISSGLKIVGMPSRLTYHREVPRHLGSVESHGEEETKR